MKQLLLRSLLGFGIFAALFGLVIFIFGDEATLHTELPQKVPVLRTESLPKSSNLTGENLTDAFGKTIAARIIEQNEAGPEALEGKKWLTVDDPDQLVQDLLTEKLESFDPASLYPKIDFSRLKISSDVSKSAQENYFAAFSAIIVSRFSNLELNELSPEQTNFPDIIAAFKLAQNDFYALSAPKDLVDFHTREIILLGAHENMFILVRDYQTDPISALLASRAIDQAFNQSVALLQEIDAYAVAKGIKI